MPLLAERHDNSASWLMTGCREERRIFRMTEARDFLRRQAQPSEKDRRERL